MHEAKRPKQLRHALCVSFGKRLSSWKFRNEAGVKGLDEIGSCPLQQEFRDEHAVRIASLAPRKPSATPRKPLERASSKPIHSRRGAIVMFVQDVSQR